MSFSVNEYVKPKDGSNKDVIGTIVEVLPSGKFRVKFGHGPDAPLDWQADYSKDEIVSCGIRKNT